MSVGYRRPATDDRLPTTGDNAARRRLGVAQQDGGASRQALGPGTSVTARLVVPAPTLGVWTPADVRVAGRPSAWSGRPRVVYAAPDVAGGVNSAATTVRGHFGLDLPVGRLRTDPEFAELGVWARGLMSGPGA